MPAGTKFHIEPGQTFEVVAKKNKDLDVTPLLGIDADNSLVRIGAVLNADTYQTGVPFVAGTPAAATKYLTMRDSDGTDHYIAVSTALT